MSPRFVIYVLAFFTFVAVIEGCDTKSTKPKSNQGRKSREAEAPITVGESGFGLLLRQRNTKEDPRNAQVTELFRRIDSNRDNRVDAAEWVDFSKKTSVWDFVDLYSYTDGNDSNRDNRVDAAEWVDFSKKTSVWDFVDLYSYTDGNDDEAVSLEELLSIQIVEVSSDDMQDNVGVTSWRRLGTTS